MAEDDSTSFSFGTGGDPYSSGLGMLALLGGGKGLGGAGTDPYLAMLQPQMQYAQGLLGQASQATPVASPWQAGARALSGVLGGLGMRDYGQQYQRTLAGEIGEAHKATQEALSGIGQSAAPPSGTPATAAPQAATAPANLDAIVTAASAKSGIPKPVLVGLYKHESDFNPAAVNATSGASGLGQVLMSTALKPGYGLPPLADNEDAAKQALLDPAKNVDFSSQYLAARGKDLFGDKWNPNDETQIKAALNAYGDGTAGYADAVLSKGGWKVPAVTVAQNDATTNPQANLQAGWQAALQLQERIALMANSPNRFTLAALPHLAQIANTLKTVGLYSTIRDPINNQLVTRNNMTGETKPAATMPTLETANQDVVTRVNDALNKGQQPPVDLMARYPQAYQALYGTKTELDPNGRLVTYASKPAPSGTRTPNQLISGASTASTGAAPQVTETQQRIKPNVQLAQSNGVPVPEGDPYAGMPVAEANKAAVDERKDAVTKVTADESQVDSANDYLNKAHQYIALTERLKNQGLLGPGALQAAAREATLKTNSQSSADLQTLIALAKELVPAARLNSGISRVTNMDIKMFMEGGLDVDKNPDATMNIANGMLRKFQVDRDHAQFRSNYVQANGTLRGETPAWAAYQRENPLFTLDSSGNMAPNTQFEDAQTWFHNHTDPATGKMTATLPQSAADGNIATLSNGRQFQFNRAAGGWVPLPPASPGAS
jgi:hypothetical protein